MFFLVELAFGVVRAVEVIVKHFSQTPDAAKKVCCLCFIFC